MVPLSYRINVSMEATRVTETNLSLHQNVRS